MQDRSLPVAQEQKHFSRRAILCTMSVVLCVAAFVSLDITIVATALPGISADLNDFTHSSWVSTAYLLGTTSTGPLYGKLSDIFGRKPILLCGLTLFLTGSVLGGAAPSMLFLILARALQGLGGGAMIPIGQIIMGDIFSPRERGRWQGYFQGAYTFAAFIGPSIGGWITQYLSWRWVFYVNLFPGVIVLLITVFFVPAIRGSRKTSVIDYVGAALLIAGSTMLLLALTQMGEQRDIVSEQSIALLGVALLALAAFVWHEIKVERGKGQPILELSLFVRSKRIFALCVLAAFANGVAQFGLAYLLPLLFQGVIGLPTSQSGMLFALLTLASFVGGIVSGQWLSWSGRYKGVALVAMGSTVLGLLLWLSSIQLAPLFLVLALVLPGFGIGCNGVVYNVIVQNALPDKISQGSSAITFFRMIGATVGVAIIGLLVNLSVHLANTSAVPTRSSLNQGIHLAFIFLLGLLLAGLLAATVLKEIPLQGRFRKLRVAPAVARQQNSGQGTGQLGEQLQSGALLRVHDEGGTELAARLELVLTQATLHHPYRDHRPVSPLIALLDSGEEKEEKGLADRNAAIIEYLSQLGGVTLVLPDSIISPEVRVSSMALLMNEELFQEIFDMVIWPLFALLLFHHVRGIHFRHLVKEPKTWIEAPWQAVFPVSWEGVIQRYLALLAWLIGLPILGEAEERQPAPFSQEVEERHFWMVIPNDCIEGPESDRPDLLFRRFITACTEYIPPSFAVINQAREEIRTWLRQQDRALVQEVRRRQLLTRVESLDYPPVSRWTKEKRLARKRQQMGAQRRTAQGHSSSHHYRPHGKAAFSFSSATVQDHEGRLSAEDEFI